MKEREKVIVTGMVILMLLAWLGFPLHHSDRFAGSFWGGMFGIAGAILMLVPLAYMVVKRNRKLKKAAKKYVSMRTLLAWHIYAGVIGPILVIIHSGHKYESLIGKVLIALTLLVVVSGFIGRYLMSGFSKEIKEKKAMLKQFQAAYDQAAIEVGSSPAAAESLRPFSGFFSRLFAGFFLDESAPSESTSFREASVSNSIRLVRLAESIADVEYAIRTHEDFKKWFGKWLKLHIIISMLLYFLMTLHIWAAIHFGLRWFEPTAVDHFNRQFSSQQFESSESSLGDPEILTALAVDEFNVAFAELYQATWRPTAIINGVSTTVFDYSEWARQAKQPQSNFSNAVAALRRVQPPSLGGSDREKAFWINVYNFTAMKMAAENYPVDSITSSKISLTKNPWGKKSITVGDEEFTLKQIEGKQLLEKFDDPRIVFAVSCVAVSCPDRTSEVFDGERIDSQLDDMIRAFMKNPDKGLRIDQATNTLTISWIVQADKRLFKETEGNGVLDFISRYATPDVVEWIQANRANIQIDYFEHDWSLNDLALAEKGEQQ